jgi:CRP-like cAMP-binding protein
MLENCPIQPESFKLRSSVPLYSDQKSKDYFYVVREGNLAYTLRDRTLFYFQEGDCIGFERELDVFTPVITSDFAVLLDRYPQSEFLEYVQSDTKIQLLWHEYIGRYIAALYVVARSLFKDSDNIVPEVRNYSPGEVILKQGEIKDEVLTLADGVAELSRDGETIGQVFSDEVIGFISSLSNSEKSASLIAVTDCLVLAMNSSSYLELLATRPSLARSIVQDFAENINKSSNQLAGNIVKL